MKTFFSESTVDYSSYTFNYTMYAVKEHQSELSEIYKQGFLPYTGNINLKAETFYKARSLRVNLELFEDTSENRRVCRMIEPLNINLELIAKEDFDLSNPVFNDFCTQYITERIGDDNMSLERWAYILEQETGSHIFKFYNEEKVFGYVLAALNEELVHYWFSFFDTEYMRSHSLGKWMMWKVIDWSKKNNRKYAYLGTAYKPAALYKIRDHKALEYWDGNNWISDVKTLKEWCQTDLEEKTMDRFKALENPDELLNNL